MRMHIYTLAIFALSYEKPVATARKGSKSRSADAVERSRRVRDLYSLESM